MSSDEKLKTCHANFITNALLKKHKTRKRNQKKWEKYCNDEWL